MSKTQCFFHDFTLFSLHKTSLTFPVRLLRREGESVSKQLYGYLFTRWIHCARSRQSKTLNIYTDWWGCFWVVMVHNWIWKQEILTFIQFNIRTCYYRPSFWFTYFAPFCCKSVDSYTNVTISSYPAQSVALLFFFYSKFCPSLISHWQFLVKGLWGVFYSAVSIAQWVICMYHTLQFSIIYIGQKEKEVHAHIQSTQKWLCTSNMSR